MPVSRVFSCEGTGEAPHEYVSWIDLWDAKTCTWQSGDGDPPACWVCGLAVVPGTTR